MHASSSPACRTSPPDNRDVIMHDLDLGCLRHLLSIIANTFDAYSTVLFMRETPERFRLAAFFSLGDDLAPSTVIAPGKGLVGWVLRNNQPLLVNNFELQSESLGYYSGHSESVVKAFMGCPLQDGMGVLCVDSKKSYSFSTKDQKILHQFTDLVTLLRSDNNRIETNKKDFAFYQALQEMQGLRKQFPAWSAYLQNFLRLLVRSTGMQHAMLAVRDEYGQNYFMEGWTQNLPMPRSVHGQTLPIGSGLVGWVFKNETPIFSTDKESGHGSNSLFAQDFLGNLVMHTVLCLPLTVHKKTRAVLVLADPDSHEISKEMRAFLQLVTEYLEYFLENLYLKNQLAKLKKQVTPPVFPQDTP